MTEIKRKNNLILGLFVALFKLSLGFIAYPLYLHYLSSIELTIYFLFISTGIIIELLDFSFSGSLSRYFAYASNYNLAEQNNIDKKIQVYHPMLLLHFAKIHYRILSLLTILILIVGFSFYLYFFTRLHHTSFWNFEVIWILYSLSTLLVVYFSYMSPLLIGFGHIDKLNKISFISRVCGFVVQVILIVCNFGLITLAISAFISAVIERSLLYLAVKELIVDITPRKMSKAQMREIFSEIWKTTYKLGLITLSWLLISRLNSFVIGISIKDVHLLNQYLFTFQIITILMGLSHVPISNNYGDISSFYVSDINKSIHVFLKANKQSIWIMVVLSVLMLLFGDIALNIVGVKHSLLPVQYSILMVIIYIFEKQLVNHSTMISVRNEVPMLGSYLTSGILIALTIIILTFLKIHNLWCYLLPQLIFQSVYNYWYWVKYNLKKFNIQLLEYLKNIFVL